MSGRTTAAVVPAGDEWDRYRPVIEFVDGLPLGPLAWRGVPSAPLPSTPVLGSGCSADVKAVGGAALAVDDGAGETIEVAIDHEGAEP